MNVRIRQRGARWLAVLLAVCVGGGHGHTKVLCLQADGHAEVEFLSTGPEAVGCNAAQGGGALQYQRPDSCGACVDLPLPFGQGGRDLPQPQRQLAVGPMFVQPGVMASAWVPDSLLPAPVKRSEVEPPGLSLLSTVVLLN